MFESSNRRQFQKGLDAEQLRSSRRSTELSLRRKTREAHLQKRMRTGPSSAVPGQTANGLKPELRDIPKYVADVMQTDSLKRQLEGTTALRMLLSAQRDPPTERIARCGVIPKIIQSMYTTERGRADSANKDILERLKLEAAWVITNVAASTTQCTTLVAQHGAIEGFVDLLKNATSFEAADQAVWGLGNIAGESKALRNRIMDLGVLQCVVDSLSAWHGENAAKTNAVWAISNIVRYSTNMSLDEVRMVLPALCKMLRQQGPDEAVVKDLLWCFNYLSSQSDEVSKFMVDSGTVSDCMKLLHKETMKYTLKLNQGKTETIGLDNDNANAQSGSTTEMGVARNLTKSAALAMNDHIYRPCLRFLGNILSGPDELTQIVIDAGYLDVIQPFADHFCATQRKEMIWSLSNILAGSHQQIEAVLSRKPLIRSIINAAHCDRLCVRREACWCICNATVDAISEQKKQLADAGAITALCTILNPANDLNEEQLVIMVEGLDGFLSVYGQGSYNPYMDQVEESNGLDFLEDRQADPNLGEASYQAIVDLVQKYWGDKDNLVEEAWQGEEHVLKDKLVAKVDENTNQFAFGGGCSSVGGQENGENNSSFANHNNNASRFQF